MAMRKTQGRPKKKGRCRFCTKGGCPRPAFVDYKDVALLRKMCTGQGKVLGRKRTGSCAAFQRAVAGAVKRARFLALLPYVGDGFGSSSGPPR
jgi:small subunit ribosomal protein S18